jgi:hypothetical protein
MFFHSAHILHLNKLLNTMIEMPSKLINFAVIPLAYDHSDDTCFRAQERDNDRYLIDIKDRYNKVS